MSWDSSRSAAASRKGETLKDTARNIEAMKVDMVVMRHPASGASHYLTGSSNPTSSTPATAGTNIRPRGCWTCTPSARRVGRLEGLHVCLVGDILHSRVARSNIFGLRTMGAKVSVCGPATMIPRGIEALGVDVVHHLDDILPQVDVLNVLRIQMERDAGRFFPNIREYHNFYGITRQRLEKAGRAITILHPGPINRDVEISADVADSEHSVILQQVLNGVAVRMAVLYLLSSKS